MTTSNKNRNIFTVINKKTNNLLGSTIFSISTGSNRALLDYVRDNTIDKLIKNTENKYELKHYLILLKDYFELTYDEISELSNHRKSIIKDVFSGRRNPSRTLIIGLCFAFKLNVIESNYLLKCAGYNELYHRNCEDIIIQKSIVDELTIHQLNERLDEYGYNTIGNLGCDQM